MMEAIACKKQSGAEHWTYELHPAAMDRKGAEEWREKKIKVPFEGVPCGCKFTMTTSLLDECDECQEALHFTGPQMGLWKCAECGDRDVRELVILHGEDGKIMCVSCLTGCPQSELPGSTGNKLA